MDAYHMRGYSQPSKSVNTNNSRKSCATGQRNGGLQQENQSYQNYLPNDYSHICSSSGVLGQVVGTTNTHDSRTVKTQQLRQQQDAHSNLSSDLIFNTMNNQKVPSQSKGRQLNIQRECRSFGCKEAIETYSNSNRMMHRKLCHVEPSSTHLSANRSSKSLGSAGGGAQQTNNQINNRRASLSDNARSQNTLSQRSRSNLSEDRTTRRSISDIRQRYCQLKQQEVENEWRIQDARDKQEARKQAVASSIGPTSMSPKTQDNNFENNETQVQGGDEYQQMQRDTSPNLMALRVNCNSESYSKIASSCNDLDAVASGNINHSNIHTILNSQYIPGDAEAPFFTDSRENRPFQKPETNNNTMPYSQTMINSVTDTIKTQDLSQTIQENTGIVDVTSCNQRNGNKLKNNESSTTTEVQGYTEFFSVGAGSQGQLGRPQAQSSGNCFQSNPKSLSFDIIIKQITCGGSHVLLLSSSFDLFAFGSNSHGQLGLNDKHFPFSTAPLLVHPTKRIQGRITRIKAGGKHNLMVVEKAATEGGGQDLYSWGCNERGECAQLIKQHPCLFMPFKVFSKVLRSQRVSDIECGEGYSGMLTNTGEVYAWGDNSCGQLGIGMEQHYFQEVREPMKVKLEEPVQQFSLGFRHSLFLTTNQQVYGCGLNQNCELGQNFTQFANETIIYEPILVPTLQDQGVQKVVAGQFSAVINMFNQVMIWGTGEFGTIRAPQKLFMDKVEFKDCKISKFQAIDGSGQEYYTPASSAFALDSNGHVYSWGSNDKGQLGQSDTRNRKLPSQILSLKRKEIRFVDIGGDFAVMLGKDIKVQNSIAELTESRMDNDQAMPFNLDVLSKIQEQGKMIQDSIMVKDFNGNDEGRRTEQQPKFGNDHDNARRSKSRKSQEHQSTKQAGQGGGTGPNSNVKRKQVSGVLKTSVISDNQSKYVTTEPRQNFVLPPYQTKGKKQEKQKKLRACTLPRSDVQENMNRILSTTSNNENASNAVANASDRVNLSMYHLSSVPQSPPQTGTTKQKSTKFDAGRSNDFMSNTYQYITMTDNNDYSHINMNHRKLFMGETAMKAKKKLAHDIGANLSDDSQSSAADAPAAPNPEDLYIHKLKSKHLKSQLKKLLNQSAQQICGLQLQMQNEMKRREEAEAKLSEIQEEMELQGNNYKEQINRVEQRCSEINIEARKKEMKCQEKLREIEEMEMRQRTILEQTRQTFQHQMNDLEHDYKTREQQMRSQIEVMQQRINHFEKAVREQSNQINRYKGIDLEKNQLISRVQQLEQEAIVKGKEHDDLRVISEELQRTVNRMEEEVKKEKKLVEKHDQKSTQEKSKRKDIEKERDRLSEKLKAERDQTKTLNTEILELKMKYNELDGEMQSALQSHGGQRKSLDSQIEQLKNEVAILQKAMEEQKNSFEQQVVSLTQSKVHDVGQLHQQIQDLQMQIDESQRKNKELQKLLSDKSQHLETLVAHVKNECIEKSAILDDNERLDDIIERLEKRNKELSEMLGQQAYKQAEDYKQKLFHKLVNKDVNSTRNNQMNPSSPCATDKKMQAQLEALLQTSNQDSSNQQAKSGNQRFQSNQFSSICQDLASTQKLEDRLITVRNDNIHNPSMFMPTNRQQQQVQSVSNFNLNQFSSCSNSVQDIQSQFPKQQLKDNFQQNMRAKNHRSLKTENIGSSNNSMTAGPTFSMSTTARGVPNVEGSTSARGVEKVPTASQQELSPPMITSNQNRSARFAQDNVQGQHGGIVVVNKQRTHKQSMPLRNRSQSGGNPQVDQAKGSHTEINKTRSKSPSSYEDVHKSRDGGSRSSSIKRVEHLRQKEREIQINHQLRQDRRKNAYDKLIQQIYDASGTQSFVQNQAVRSMASDPELLKQQQQYQTIQVSTPTPVLKPTRYDSLNQLPIGHRSLNKTPQFDNGSNFSSMKNLQQQQQYQTVGGGYHAEDKRMKSMEVRARQPRNNLRLNRLQLDESFNKIEHLLKQTKDLQEQTKELRCSSSSQFNHLSKSQINKYSNDNLLSQDVGPTLSSNHHHQQTMNQSYRQNYQTIGHY